MKEEEGKALWQAAGRCYAAAGKYADAGRCYAHAGEAGKAAACYERAGKWRQAAEQYEQAGDRLRAGWLYADKLRMYETGRHVQGRAWRESGSSYERLAGMLVQARCDAGIGARERAAWGLYTVLEAEEADKWREELRPWALSVAEGLGRPDLAVRAQVELRGSYEEGQREWEAWSRRMLGMDWGYAVKESEGRGLYRAGHGYVEPLLEMEMMWIPSGEFWMGAEDITDDEKPVHRVRMSGYWLGRYPVTNRQYGKYMETSGATEPQFWSNAKYNQGEQPVVGVSWEEAERFCQWLSEESRQRYELPSEAQWEYAARGTESWSYPWGEEEPNEERAHYGQPGAAPLPVGSKPAGRGPYGTEDQAGNVDEWCRDLWDEEAYQKRGSGVAENPETSTGNPMVRPLRGGAFDLDAGRLRAAYRGRNGAVDWFVYFGFRVAARPPSRDGT